jgi:hypothetical protein
LIFIETLVYSQKEVADLLGFAGSEISNWKLMIEQFAALKIQNEKEASRLRSSSKSNDNDVLKEIEIMETLNTTLDEAIDECLDQILRNQERIRNFSGAIQNN